MNNYIFTENIFQYEGPLPQKMNSVISYHSLIMFEFLLCSTACLALLGLVVWHFRLISKGETSIEMYSNLSEKARLKALGQVGL